ncbi:hypothetical protein AB0H29_08395 [Streptomyces thermolilacinus]
MPCDIIERMAACGDCRTLAVDYGMTLTDSRRPGAPRRDWELPLTTSRVRLDTHLITAHGAWLPERQPDCDVCEAWRTAHLIGPIEEAEALHRAWHLCAPLREICTPGKHEIGYLMR